MTTIRPFKPEDWPQVWPILSTTFKSGDTYAFSPDSTEQQIHHAWIELPQATYVAVSQAGEIVATYTLKPNQPGLGSHVCNCGYVVAASARGQGLAARLCEHSQEEARRLGYRAMQFNLVVATNEVAVRLWQRLGFTIVGTLPGAFRHSSLGFVNAYVMHKPLVAA
jgi:ribosomal protein S18 acetylase RimI-like enzyme